MIYDCDIQVVDRPIGSIKYCLRKLTKNFEDQKKLLGDELSRKVRDALKNTTKLRTRNQLTRKFIWQKFLVRIPKPGTKTHLFTKTA